MKVLPFGKEERKQNSGVMNLAFLSELEALSEMEKTRDLFKKIRDTKGTFHAKMGSIKDRNGMVLTEAEDIKTRWQEYWSGLPFPSPGDLPHPGIEPSLLQCRQTL